VQQSSTVKQEDKSEGTSPEHLGNKVFVGGLPLHVDKDGLQDFFSCFGPVTDVSITKSFPYSVR
jgi:RNA recognition motif-containing protein